MTSKLRRYSMHIARRLSIAEFDLNSAMNGLKTNIPASLFEVEELQKQLFAAVERNDFEEVTDFIKKHVHVGKIPIDARNENGETPLIVSCRLGHLQLTRLFIRSGADVDAKDIELWSPLLNAAKNGFLEIVQMLIDSEADIEQSDVGGWTPLFWAVYKNRLLIVLKLIEYQAEVNVVDEYGMMPLLWAAGRGYGEIVRELLQSDARVNARDRFGNSALIWATKKACLAAVMALLSYDATVDVVGVNGMTPLIMAAKLNQKEIVEALLPKNPNVNAVDQYGITALGYAAFEGNAQVVEMLLSAGAYVNVADRKKDTVLMKAVKSGQSDVVRALLTKYADVDAQDEDCRTALHLAIDKGHVEILSLIVGQKPNTELRSKEGDTPLLKAVRSRNLLMVQLLVSGGAKVAAADKRGDSSLHIALRCRSRRLTQILLSRPQDSRLLYMPNKAGETPYSIDQSHSQPILPHIFGPAESQVQTEAMLGYDLYSNIIADIMCEPMLSLPLTIGLYAKWGSGKSFLLNKLRDSLSLFSRSWMDMKEFAWSWVISFIILFLSCIIGITIYGAASSSSSWIPALCVFFVLLILLEALYAFVVFGRNRYCRLIKSYLTRYFIQFRLLLQILFYHPPVLSERDLVTCPVGFVFANYHRLSSIGGAQALANIIETLYVELENLYGTATVRLCSAFSPSYSSQSSPEFRRLCGIPIFGIVGVILLSVLLALFLCAAYIHDSAHGPALIAIGGVVLSACVILGCYPLFLAIFSVVHLRARREIRRAVAHLDRLHFEGLMQKLSRQVQLLEDTVHRLDSYACAQTRLVIFVDGLDSCEQERMVQTLDAIQILFCNKQNSPFAIFIAVDPHIVVSAIEKNLSTAFTQTDLSGYDYLKNLIHMPFYLQNTAIQKLHERLTGPRKESLEFVRMKYTRSDTVYGSYISLTESRTGSARMRRAVSQTLQEHQNLGQRIVHDDYFTNINPRSMRRVVNTLTLSGRLMRAFDLDFNWIALGHWVSLVEQWPYRLSWIINYCEHTNFADSVTMREVYDVIKTRIPALKTEDSMVEIDRNPRNFELYLENNREPILTVGHVRNFVPFTSNLDPYIRKLIHDKYATTSIPKSDDIGKLATENAALSKMEKLLKNLPTGWAEIFKDPSFNNVRLSCSSVDEVCSLIKRLPLSSNSAGDDYCSKLKSANISGLVLSACDLDELKPEFKMTFGDWTLFVLMVRTLRTREAEIGDDEMPAYQPRQLQNSSGSQFNTWRRRHRSRSKPSASYEPSQSETAEVSATHDWLNFRLGHLDAVEFSGDRELVETPKTSRRSSVIQEERVEDSHSASSPFDSEDRLKTASADAVGDLSKANLTRRLQGLVQAITGTIEETGQLLIGAGSGSSGGDSDNDSKETEQQLTIRRKQLSDDKRPSVFDLMSQQQQQGSPQLGFSDATHSQPSSDVQNV